MTEQNSSMTPQERVNILSDVTDTDILFYNAGIGRPQDSELISLVCNRKRRTNVTLILVTGGGDADAAYRMVRCLQRSYQKFTLLVPGFCKSAGTLMALGAHEIVMGDHAELGPLDVQMTKKDDLSGRISGLAIPNALKTLQAYAYQSFEEYFLTIIKKSGSIITTQTASKIASDMSIGMLAPIYQQLDPIAIGEQGRAVSVANHYGMRLTAHTGNVQAQSALTQLITQYPSHSFVIDREEAFNLFGNVRIPIPEEQFIIDSLGQDGLKPSNEPAVCYLNEELVPTAIAPAPVSGTPIAKTVKTANAATTTQAKTQPPKEKTPEDANDKFVPEPVKPE